MSFNHFNISKICFRKKTILFLVFQIGHKLSKKKFQSQYFVTLKRANVHDQHSGSKL